MMRPIWTIARNDLRLFLKDKAGYAWLFVMPLAFTLFFGVAMKGGRGAPANPRPAVLIENNDRGYLGALLMEEMDAQGLRLIKKGGEEKAPRGIRIPEDFTEKVEAKERVKIQFFKVDESGDQAALLIEARLIRAIMGVTSGLFSIVTDPNGPELSEDALRAKLTLCVYAWGCAALGVLIGAVMTGDDKVQGVCTLLSLVMAAMGGCWWPIEYMPDTAKMIGHAFPTAWAMDAMHQLISFGGGWAQVVQELGVLAGFAGVATFAAGKFMRY